MLVNQLLQHLWNSKSFGSKIFAKHKFLLEGKRITAALKAELMA